MEIVKGDWVVITTKSNPDARNLNSSMQKLDGMILQLPENDERRYEMVKGNRTHHWCARQGHFRLAEPHEIPGAKPNEPNYEIY